MPELYTEPIAGYRTWVMEAKEPVITGVIHRLVWPPFEDAQAICRKNIKPDGQLKKGMRRSRHKIPSLKCQCGFWAFKDYEELQKSVNYCWGTLMKSVRGAFIGWGRVQITEQGFRAEYARPVALLKWDERRVSSDNKIPLTEDQEMKREFWNDQLEKIAKVYRVPLVATENELVEIGNELGTPIT